MVEQTKFSIIATVPPYVSYIERAVGRPIVEGARLNTIVPITGKYHHELNRLALRVFPKDLWVDLKCRQLRVTNFPGDYVELSHKIEVETPVEAVFHRRYQAEIVEVKGNKLFLKEKPHSNWSKSSECQSLSMPCLNRIWRRPSHSTACAART